MMTSQDLLRLYAVLLLALTLTVGSLPAWGASIVNTKHNLSVSGPGSIRALKETRVCIFCHTPHNSAPGNYLWNRADNPVTYDIYRSSTLQASVKQPSGASKLCLSCHDGTLALGLVRAGNDSISMTGGFSALPKGLSRLGADLSDDHPVSFSYDNFLVSRNSELYSPDRLRETIQLDDAHQLQCTSCHNPHEDKYGKFLVMDNSYSALCTSCHRKAEWKVSSHATSSRTWNGAPPNPWSHTKYDRVDLNGCENCHRPHSAGLPPGLLTAGSEEATCLSCHNGNVARSNIKTDLLKASSRLLGYVSSSRRRRSGFERVQGHSRCSACHNPHATRSGTSSPPYVSGSLKGVLGVNSAGNPVSEAQYQYQICYKCHADEPSLLSPTIPRQAVQENVRMQFDPSNLSYHPVEAAGRNPEVPSLLSPYTPASIIFCTDCHNNDSGPGASGMGSRGPHGSNHAFLLERRLETQDKTPESPVSYALCYKCHDRNNLLRDQSFRHHRKHILDESTPCSVCHDPHGVPAQAHLINFDRRVVSASSKGEIRFEDLGDLRGRCYLKCHGSDHSPREY